MTGRRGGLMTNEEAIKFLSQIRDALLASNSWLPSTHNPIKESFGMAINALSAQPETHEERTETHACDCIDRQAAIKALRDTFKRHTTVAIIAMQTIKDLPSAQPKIVRCKECVYADENYHCDYMTTWNYGDCFCSYGRSRTDG